MRGSTSISNSLYVVTRMLGLEIPTKVRLWLAQRLTVGLVDLESLDLVLRMAVLELVGVSGRRVPEASVVDGRNVEILCHSGYPRRDTVNRFSRGDRHGDLHHRIMGDGADTVGRGRDVAFPDSKVVLRHRVGGMRPIV